MEQWEFFNKLAKEWDRTRNSNPSLLRELVAKLGLKPEDRVLDLGSGTGVLLPYLASEVKEVVAVDFAKEMLKVSEEKNRAFQNIKYVVADVANLDFPGETFQQITCLNFFPHVEAKKAFLKDMYKLLKVGGHLTIMHDIPRAKVNHIHGSCQQVQEDRLMPAEKLGAILGELGFAVTALEDTDQYYFVQGKKE